MSGRGNPNHDPHTGRFTSGGGGGSNRSMQQRMHRELGRRARAGEQHTLQPDGSHKRTGGMTRTGMSVAENKAFLKSGAFRPIGASVPAHKHFGQPTTTTPKTGDYNIAKDPTRNGTYGPPGSGIKNYSEVAGAHTIRGGRHRFR